MNSSKLYLAQLATASIMAPKECHKDVTWSSLSCFTGPFLSSFLQYGRVQCPAGWAIAIAIKGSTESATMFGSRCLSRGRPKNCVGLAVAK